MSAFAVFARGTRRVTALLCLALPAQLSAAFADSVGTLSWETRAPVIAVNECGVEGAAASVIDGKIYVSHGFSCGDNAALRIYDIHTDTWTLGPAASVPRSELAGVAVGGKHYAIGGRAESVLSDVEIFDPASGTWSAGPPMPTARAGLCATVLDGKIHVIGGRDGTTPGSGSPLAAHEVFDPGENSWSTKASLPTAVMDDYACVALDGKIYVFGGADIEEEEVLTVTGATQIYDPSEDGWTSGAPMPSPRSNAVAGVLNSHPIVVGGAVPDFEFGFFSNVSTVSIYHPATDSWTSGPTKPTAGSEFGASMIVSGNVLFAIGSGIEGASSTVHEALVVSAPVCTGTPADGGVNGTATSNPDDPGLVSAELAPGASNVSLECATCPFPLTTCDPTPCATLGGVSEIFFRATSTGGDAQGTVVVKDAAGGSCTTSVTITSLPPGPVRDQTVCAGGGVLLRESNDTSLGSGATSSCGGSVLEPDDPLLPVEYAPSPAGDPFPCRVFTLDAPYSGSTQETYKVDGVFNPRLRLLFSAQDESGSFPAYTDVTETVEPIIDLADPTKLSGGTKHSLIKITCAVLKEVCDGLDNDGVGGTDGFTTFCGTGQCAASGTCTAGVDSCVAAVPSAEVCDGIDNDCDGQIDEPGCEPPLAIVLASFNGEERGESVLLSWETLMETNTAGFIIYRAESSMGSKNSVGAYVRISGSIPARGSELQGATYTFTDNDVKPGRTYFYRLDDVDLRGRATQHGPVSVPFYPSGRLEHGRTR